MNGIVIIATGHPYYGKYAVNLANSIKSVGDCHITLFYGGSALSHCSESDRAVFDNLLELKNEYWKTGESERPTKAKVYLYELTPYDNTIYLDADIAWLTSKPASELFNQLDQYKFTTISEGYHDAITHEDTSNKTYPWWGELGDIVKAYGIKKIYKTRSEFIYFKKCAETKKYFKQAQKIFDKPKIETTSFGGAGIADEFAFNVAGALCELFPHANEWTPIFWAWKHSQQKINRSEVIKNYYGLSLGGNRNLAEQEKFYNDLVRFHAQKTGLKNPMLAKHKKDFNKERRTI